MIFLLNRERVVYEVLELAKLRLSGILKVKPADVSVELGFQDGKLLPKFDVRMPAAGALEKKYIQQAIAQVWMAVAKPELESRLHGLYEVRHGLPKIPRQESSCEAPPAEGPDGEQAGSPGPG